MIDPYLSDDPAPAAPAVAAPALTATPLEAGAVGDICEKLTEVILTVRDPTADPIVPEPMLVRVPCLRTACRWWDPTVAGDQPIDEGCRELAATLEQADDTATIVEHLRDLVAAALNRGDLEEEPDPDAPEVHIPERVTAAAADDDA